MPRACAWQQLQQRTAPDPIPTPPPTPCPCPCAHPSAPPPAVPVPPALLRAMQTAAAATGEAAGAGDRHSPAEDLAAMQRCRYREVPSIPGADWAATVAEGPGGGSRGCSSRGHQAVLINPGWECEGRGDAAVQVRVRGFVCVFWGGGLVGWVGSGLLVKFLTCRCCRHFKNLVGSTPPCPALPRPARWPSHAAPGPAAHAPPGAPRLCVCVCGQAAPAGAVPSGAPPLLPTPPAICAAMAFLLLCKPLFLPPTCLSRCPPPPPHPHHPTTQPHTQMRGWGYCYIENLTWVYLQPNARVLALPSRYANSSHLTLLMFRREGVRRRRGAVQRSG